MFTELKNLMFICVFLLASLLFINDVNASGRMNHKEVSADSLNVRQEPSTKGKIIDVLKKGEKVQVLGEKGNWLNVGYKKYRQGWVDNKYVMSPDMCGFGGMQRMGGMQGMPGCMQRMGGMSGGMMQGGMGCMQYMKSMQQRMDGMQQCRGGMQGMKGMQQFAPKDKGKYDVGGGVKPAKQESMKIRDNCFYTVRNEEFCFNPRSVTLDCKSNFQNGVYNSCKVVANYSISSDESMDTTFPIVNIMCHVNLRYMNRITNTFARRSESKSSATYMSDSTTYDNAVIDVFFPQPVTDAIVNNVSCKILNVVE